MWFRARSQQNENDHSRVASFRNRIRPKKSVTKCETDSKDHNTASAKPITATPNRIRDDGNGYVLRSQSGRRLSLLSDDDDNSKEKNKMLRVDQKYKKNRVTKSASRTKIPDIKIEKPNLSKNSTNSSSCNSQRKTSTPLIDLTSPSKAKTSRRNTTLNLNALLRYKSFISGSTKKLTSDDFERIRRKSLGDTGKIRRKSNPDTDKTNPKSKLQQSSSIESNILSDDDFNTNEKQLNSSLGKPKTGCDFLNTTSKKTKFKNKTKGFYSRNMNLNELCSKIVFFLLFPKEHQLYKLLIFLYNF